MKNLKDFIKVYDTVLDKNICQDIIKNSDKSKFERAATYGLLENEDDIKYTEERSCYHKMLSQEFDKTVFKTVGNILNFYENDIGSFGTGSEGIDTGYIHLLYKGSERGKYETHIDHLSANPRQLSISILLNDNFDGGNFCFFDEYIIEKKVGSAIVFPSNFMFPHAVLPVSNGDRHAIITWIR